jgi:hypothetical protein
MNFGLPERRDEPGREGTLQPGKGRAPTHKSGLFGNRWLPQNDVCGLRRQEA